MATAKEGAALNLEFPFSLYFAGRMALQTGNAEAASRYLDTLVEAVPRLQHVAAELYRDALRAEIALEEGRSEEARELFEKNLNSGKLNADVLNGWLNPGTAFRSPERTRVQKCGRVF